MIAVPDLYVVGLAPNTAPLTNLTTGLTGSTGYTSDIAFANTGLGLFTAASASSAGPYQLYSDRSRPDPPGAPHALTGPPAATAKGPGGGILVSPFGDRIAFLDDLETPNVFDLYVLDLPNGAPIGVNRPLTGTVPQIQQPVWGGDNDHLIYQMRTQPCAAPQRDLFYVDLTTSPPTTTQLNPPVTGCHPPVGGVVTTFQVQLVRRSAPGS